MIAQPIVRGTIVKNHHVADGRLFLRRALAAHDWVGSQHSPNHHVAQNLQRRIQCACTSPVATRIQATQALQAPVSSHSWDALSRASH
ncbi:hypothetical protein TNCV_1909721 [Trichonephila clavipes]|nr:hypothetical protein TNCV_1909721 [Trichonephila clavipes]